METFKISLLLFFICMLLAISCERKTTGEESRLPEEQSDSVEVTPEQFKTAGIILGNVVHKQISGFIKVNGILDAPPQQVVSVSAPLGGFLKNTALLQGSRVRKGQVIATIGNLEFIQIQQDYLEAKNQFEFAKADYERDRKSVV